MFKNILKGRRPTYVVAEGSPETVSEKVDYVDNKVDGVADELHTVETMAGIYFVARVLSGLLSWSFLGSVI